MRVVGYMCGHRIHSKYYGYTKCEATKMFRKQVRNLIANGYPVGFKNRKNV